MAVDATSPLKVHLFSGAGTYGVTFKVLEASHIQAQLIRTDGTIVALVNGTDYSVTVLPAGAGANIVVTTTAYSAGGTIEIRRVIPVTQATSWSNGGSLDMPLLTSVFDKLTMILQQMQVYMEGEAAESHWGGDWITGTSYLVKDIVVLPSTGDWYRCLTPHTSGTWATDLAAGKWVLYLAIGEAVTAAATATGAADTATGAADTATTQAGIATGAAAAALGSENAAAASAASALSAPGTYATSTSSVTPGLGSKSLTLAQLDKEFVVGMHVVVAQTSAPATNWMHGIITAFTSSTGAMALTVDYVANGAGAASDWNVVQSGPIVEAEAPIGHDQDWATPTRAGNTAYQNPTGQSIQVNIKAVCSVTTPGESAVLRVGPSATGPWTDIIGATAGADVGDQFTLTAIIPDQKWYMLFLSANMLKSTWTELR